MNQEFMDACRWLIEQGMVEVSQPSRTYGRNPKYLNPPFLMLFLCAEDRGHKFMSIVTLCRGELSATNAAYNICCISFRDFGILVLTKEIMKTLIFIMLEFEFSFKMLLKQGSSFSEILMILPWPTNSG